MNPWIKKLRKKLKEQSEELSAYREKEKLYEDRERELDRREKALEQMFEEAELARSDFEDKLIELHEVEAQYKELISALKKTVAVVQKEIKNRRDAK